MALRWRIKDVGSLLDAIMTAGQASSSIMHESPKKLTVPVYPFGVDMITDLEINGTISAQEGRSNQVLLRPKGAR